ncbi:alpha/beta family hydrolase [Jatrophihabitans sp.]|uniref:alpha/beta hydrolase family protein n=1 Tax=Jatrophihabitans sp. TaxID=1932789 RepID=UPI0030C764C1|nr:hypothetical protein [Jatrophihabitans sp.]
MADALVVDTTAGPGWIELTRPVRPTALLALTHGAGGGVGTADLLAIRDAVTAAGVAVALITQPYRVAGRGAPPRPDKQDPLWLELMTALRSRRGLGAVPLIVGGRSNGARLACRTATGAGAVAVVALAYPLHPPGKPDVSRLDELELPTVPVLLVQGDRDAFGMPPEGPGRQRVVIAGADHSLKKGVPAVAEAVLSFVTAGRMLMPQDDHREGR